jgi:hypothetical protein
MHRTDGSLRQCAPRSTQHAARSTQHAARSTQHAARSTQHAPRATHHAPRTTHHAPHTTHHAPRTTHHAPRTTHHAPRTTHHAPRTTHLEHPAPCTLRTPHPWTPMLQQRSGDVEHHLETHQGQGSATSARVNACGPRRMQQLCPHSEP